MKLIDLLVKELPKMGGWPKWAARCALYPLNPKFIFFDDEGNSRAGSAHPNVVIRSPLYSNFDKVVITMKEYESALAASEGWIEWAGGECPVEGAAFVDYKMRSEQVDTEDAHILRWDHKGYSGDIIAYRPHKPVINSRANDDRLEQDLNGGLIGPFNSIEECIAYADKEREQDLNECIGQPVPPIEWANSGLPLVGVTCEMADENGSYKPVEIIAWRNECVIGWDSERLITYISNNPSDFRPLRTEAEKLREAAIQDLTSVICGNVPDTGMATAAMYAERVYDAGYRKESK